MKIAINIWILFMFLPLMYSGKNTSDSIISKIQMGIYEDPDRSLEMAKQLLKTEKNPNKIIEINLLISNAYVAKRSFDDSLKYILKAKKSLNENTDAKTRTNVLISIAVQYQQMELFSKSLEILDETENFISKLPNRNLMKYADMGKVYAIRGMIYKSQQNPEIALQKFLIAEKNLKLSKVSVPKYANLSVIFYNIGYCFIEMNKSEESKPYFQQSIGYAKKANAKSLEAFALKGMAEMQTLTGKYEQSIKLLSQAEKLSQNVGDLVLYEGIYKGFADNYLALNELENYKIYNKKHISMRFQREQSELKSINRSIDNQTQESKTKMSEITTKYKKMNILTLIISSFILIILMILIIKSRKKNLNFKRKNQRYYDKPITK